MTKKLPIIFLMLTVCLCSCGKATQQENNNTDITIAVSIPPEAEFIRQICGDRAKILTVIPAGYSPESYEPAPKDIAALLNADIYFTIGVPAEKSNILPKTNNIEIVNLAEAAAKKYDELKIGGERDPHIWLSPKRVSEMVSAAADKLAGIDSENASEYKKNAERYCAELSEASEQIKEILKDKSEFIVFHPAFGYFADEFGLTMYSLEKEGKEATVTELAEMIDFAKEHGIKTVFCQEEIDKSQANAFADEIGGKTVMLSPLAENYIDNLIMMANSIAEASNNK